MLTLILPTSRVYFDFDNTITRFDVLDAVIEQFSIDREWVAYEEAWRAGDIGSKECLEGQLRSIRCTRESLAEYLATVTLDAHFKRLFALLQVCRHQAGYFKRQFHIFYCLHPAQ